MIEYADDFLIIRDKQLVLKLEIWITLLELMIFPGSSRWRLV